LGKKKITLFVLGEMFIRKKGEVCVLGKQWNTQTLNPKTLSVGEIGSGPERAYRVKSAVCEEKVPVIRKKRGEL